MILYLMMPQPVTFDFDGQSIELDAVYNRCLVGWYIHFDGIYAFPICQAMD